MKRNINYKLILLLIVPYLASEIINRLMGYGISLNSSLLLTISSILLSLWTFSSVVLWFWVGRQFGSLTIEKIKSFILGNVIWAISLALYIWQFIFVDDINRNFFVAGISQHYLLGFVSWGSKVVGLFTNTIDGTVVVIVAYLMMFIVFTVGFITSPTFKIERKLY
ncbi:hypothetical protein CIW83_04880 [Tissierella sp. P1]|uniref:hypothetical protein n=1 Tax=unclassified Tissierella TaxID=2638726 RepID=UPI000B9FA648|nr:hypothetical protein [Tissierella sp. P1]OZV13211.1 hypothetical protein CIW83_04880 [Tissierella sp. P1]